MKTVFDPKLKEVITIDEKKEANWKKKYYHRSGVPFEGNKKTEAKEEGKKETLEQLEIETLRKVYEDTLGKKVSNNKKNDRERIISKLI